MIQSLPFHQGELLFPIIIHSIEDPAWEVRAAVCRTLSFLKLPQSLPFLIKAAADPDWIVRANATRALGKFGDLGEQALLMILFGEDHYASEAALAILENQGFLQRHIENLNHPEKAKQEIALKFIRQLAMSGKSRLADVLIEKNKLGKFLGPIEGKNSVYLTSKRYLFLQKIRGKSKK